MNFPWKGSKFRRLLPARNQSVSLARQPDAVTEAPDSPRHGRAANDGDDSFLGALARKARDDRRRRARIPGTVDLFGEPAWDLLLHLFIAAREAREVSFADACEGAATPESPALRWIAILEKRGLVATDAERRTVRLTLKGYAGLADYFRGV